MKYLVVLFKNKQKKKIIKKFKTYERVKAFFDKKVSETIDVYDKRIENGEVVSFELGILEKNSTNFEILYKKDELGRNVKVDLDDPDYKIIEIRDYKVEELIYDIGNNEKITFSKFIKKYIPKSGIKLLSKINNKVVVQEDEKLNIFSLKSDSDCYRFLVYLQNYLIDNNRTDCIVVFDVSTPQKKYLYHLLESKGISKSALYRKSTTFISEKSVF
jgi:hypothetical protein